VQADHRRPLPMKRAPTISEILQKVGALLAE
jgi:hypothetical protein